MLRKKTIEKLELSIFEITGYLLHLGLTEDNLIMLQDEIAMSIKSNSRKYALKYLPVYIAEKFLE